MWESGVKSNPFLSVIPARSCVKTRRTIRQNSCIWTPPSRYVLSHGKEEFEEMAVRLTFRCIVVQQNTSGLLGSEPCLLHLIRSSLCLPAAGDPLSQESSKPYYCLYRLFCSILLIPLEPLILPLSPCSQNKDPRESRHILEQLRDSKAPDFWKTRCKARATHL